MISKEQRSKLIEEGYRTTLEYFKYEYPKKRQIIDKHYENLQKYFKEIEKLLNKKYYKAAKNKLFETFVYLCEYKKYIDLAYFEEMVDFKNLFMESYSEKSGLFGTKYSLQNHNLITAKLASLASKIF